MTSLRTLGLATVAIAALLAFAPASGFAATAHNSQRGGLGNSTNNAGSTINSPHVRHHRHHRHR